MKFGEVTLHIVSDGTFYLDGGAMFGVVPKVMWNKLNPADELNRIKLGLNCLLVQTSEKNILVDTGIGEKIKERFKETYRVEREHGLVDSLAAVDVKPENIDFVVDTHLHFDHCGGNTIRKDATYVPTFPNARYVIQEQEWLAATNPNERTKASYLRENFEPLEKAGQLMLVAGEHTVVEGLKVMPTPGHTKGHQSVLIESDGKKALYCGDLIPTTSHVRLPYIMGYDLYPLDILETKRKILEQAVNEHWLLIFEHDPETPFAYLTERDGRQVLERLSGSNPKSQNPNSKQIPINKSQTSKPYDLEKRTLKFARDVAKFVKTLPKTQTNFENSKQLIKSSGSVGANYIEANESLSKKDFVMRIKICRKESKESAYWLKLLETNTKASDSWRKELIDEATQFVKIFNSIVEKSK